jgi:hypothetical protein
MTNDEAKATIEKPITIADRLKEARELFRQEKYRLPWTHRRSRPDPFPVTPERRSGE